MKLSQNPFSLFDFLGYFVPGSLFLITSYYLLKTNATIDTKYINFYDELHNDTGLTYFFLIISAYLCGHILSYLSSITIEKYSLWKYGFPSKFLLGYKEEGFFSPKRKKNFNRAYRILMAIAILPLTIPDLILGYFLKLKYFYTKSINEPIKGIIENKILLLFAEISKGTNNELCFAKDDFFSFSYHYALENAENHRSGFNNYLALYGLLRNITFILVLIFWVFIIIFIIKSSIDYIYLIGISVCCYFFYLGYMKFYRRFSQEVLYCILIIEMKNHNSNTSSSYHRE